MCHIAPLFKVARVQDHVGNIYDGNKDFFSSFFSVSGCSLSYKSFQMYCTKTCQSHVSAAGNWTFDLTASLNPTFIEKGQDPGTIRNRIKWRMKKGKRQIRHMCRIKPDLFWKLIQCHHVTVESHERKFLSSSCYLRSALKGHCSHVSIKCKVNFKQTEMECISKPLPDVH